MTNLPSNNGTGDEAEASSSPYTQTTNPRSDLLQFDIGPPSSQDYASGEDCESSESSPDTQMSVSPGQSFIVRIRRNGSLNLLVHTLPSEGSATPFTATPLSDEEMENRLQAAQRYMAGGNATSPTHSTSVSPVYGLGITFESEPTTAIRMTRPGLGDGSEDADHGIRSADAVSPPRTWTGTMRIVRRRDNQSVREPQRSTEEAVHDNRQRRRQK